MTSITIAGPDARLRVGDLVALPVTVYSRRERFLSWLLNRGWRGRLVALLSRYRWRYRPQGRQVWRDYRITECHFADSTITIEREPAA